MEPAEFETILDPIPRKRRQAEPDIQAPVITEIRVDLPPQAGDMRIDGRVFQHGGTYRVTEAQAATMREIMFRAWSHYREVRGEKMPLEALRRQNPITI